MMGSGDQPGLIPRLCSALFERTQTEQREEESFTVEVSFMEIYNEKVRDLLDPKGCVSDLAFQNPFRTRGTTFVLMPLFIAICVFSTS